MSVVEECAPTEAGGQDVPCQIIAATSDDSGPADSTERPDMKEVHPPHAAIHGWKDFFIHIVTITIGLLIATGLEQAVEYVHHRNQLQTARRELLAEVEENRQGLKTNMDELRAVEMKLDKNLAALRGGQGGHAPPIGELDYSWDFARPRNGVWQAARVDGTLELMPHAELQGYAHLYTELETTMEALKMHAVQMDLAAAMATQVHAGSASTKEIDDLIAATIEAKGKTVFLKHLLEFEDFALKDLK